MKTKYLLFAFAIFMVSCNNSEKSNKNKIIGSWKVSKVTPFDENTNSTLETQLLAEGVVMHLFPDSSYTELYGRTIKVGQWSYVNEKVIKYGDLRLIIERFEEEQSNKSLIVSIRDKDDAVKSELTLVEDVQSITDYKKDPFYSDNNKWRQRPLKKETNAEISTRLSNYILHNAYILNAAYERNGTSVSFTNSKGVIKIYQGAIGVVKENKINKAWINSFYDEEDAMKAFYLYTSYLDEGGVSKAKSTGDWVKDDYEILMALYSQVQNTQKEEVDRFTEQVNLKKYTTSR